MQCKHSPEIEAGLDTVHSLLTLPSTAVTMTACHCHWMEVTNHIRRPCPRSHCLLLCIPRPASLTQRLCSGMQNTALGAVWRPTQQAPAQCIVQFNHHAVW